MGKLKSSMRALDLFSGYGGITLALKELVEPIAYVEIEEYAQKIIAYRMADGSLPRAPILGDIKNVQGEIGDCDIIYGGFPCQDISSAGIGNGLEGERSGLLFEVIRLTKEIRPSFVFLENVPAIRTRGLSQVVKAFTEIGYGCRWTTLSAESVGAKHKRERWFLLAYTVCARLERNEEKTHQWDESKSLIRNSTRKRFMSSDWWQFEPSVGRVANGTAFRVDRIKALGNGVVPLQVRTAFFKLLGML